MTRVRTEKLAKVKMNELMTELSGQIGGLVFRQMPNGDLLVSAAPNFRRRKFSPKQKKQQQRFREAAAYARSAAKTQPVYAELAKGTMKTAYNIAVSDWFNPPVIHGVEQRDGRIHVEATDKVMVAKVLITVLEDQGTVLEKGEAIKREGNW